MIKKIQQLSGHNAAVYGLSIGTSPEKIFSGGGEGWIVEWDLRQTNTGKLIATVPDSVFSLYYDVKNKTIYAGDKSGGLHSIGTDEAREVTYQKNHKKGIYQIFCVGQDLLTCGGDGILTRYPNKNLKTFESVQLSSKSLRSICLVGENILAVGASDGNIYFLNKNSLELLHTTHNAHTDSVLSLASTGNFLLSGGKDALLQLWTIDDGQWTMDNTSNSPNVGRVLNPSNVYEQEEDQQTTTDIEQLTSINAHLSAIYAIAFHPHKKNIFATASRDKTIKIWRMNENKNQNKNPIELLKVINKIKNGGHLRSVNNLLWNNNGTLISAGDDSTLIVWEINLESIEVI